MKLKRYSLGQRMVLGIVFVLIFVYTVYHTLSLFGEQIETYAAGVTTEKVVIRENGYLFRDEVLLTSPYVGTVDYRTQDGTKVAKGQELAVVYESGSAQTRETILILDQQIGLLEQSLGASLATMEMGALKESVKDSYRELVDKMALRQTGGLSAAKEALLIDLNRMDALRQGNEAQAYATLDALREQRQMLLDTGGPSQSYAAEQSGYFSVRTDGCEETFSLDAANSLTAESFVALTDTVGQAAPREDAFGKISYSSEWMLVLPVAWDSRVYFELGQSYVGEFTHNDSVKIPMTLENLIEDAERGRVLLVFSADRLPQNFSFDRCQGVRIEVDAVSGIYVPKHLVERLDGERGIYVLRGNVVRFRHIEIVYTGEDYYLVRSGVEDPEHEYLQVNDLIILNGKNLFDGRVLD